MMKRILGVFLMMTLIVGLFACSANDKAMFGDDADEGTVGLQNETVPERKIIYTVEGTLYVADLDEAQEILTGLLEADEWIDQEVFSETSLSLRLRIKSDRLDQFMDQIDTHYDLTYLTKTATDISLDYQDVSARIDALEAEQARLLELYDGASLSDMIQIGDRLTDLDLELSSLRGELNLFDSLSDYSTVTLSVRQSHTPESVGFIRAVADGFMNGLDFVISFARGFVIVLATLVPVSLVGAPLVYVGYRIVKRMDNKKHDGKQETTLSNDKESKQDKK